MSNVGWQKGVGASHCCQGMRSDRHGKQKVGVVVVRDGGDDLYLTSDKVSMFQGMQGNMHIFFRRACWPVKWQSQDENGKLSQKEGAVHFRSWWLANDKGRNPMLDKGTCWLISSKWGVEIDAYINKRVFWKAYLYKVGKLKLADT